jgi:hypothetical protein
LCKFWRVNSTPCPPKLANCLLNSNMKTCIHHWFNCSFNWFFLAQF